MLKTSCMCTSKIARQERASMLGPIYVNALVRKFVSEKSEHRLLYISLGYFQQTLGEEKIICLYFYDRLVCICMTWGRRVHPYSTSLFSRIRFLTSFCLETDHIKRKKICVLLISICLLTRFSSLLIYMNLCASNSVNIVLIIFKKHSNMFKQTRMDAIY